MPRSSFGQNRRKQGILRSKKYVSKYIRGKVSLSEHLLIFPIPTAALTGQKTGDEDLDAVQDGVGSGVGGLVGKGGVGESIGSTLSKGL